MNRPHLSAWFILPVVLSAILVAIPAEPPRLLAADQPDGSVPIAAPFLTQSVEMKVGGAAVKVDVSYAVQGKTVFVLPAWAVVGPVEHLVGAGKIERSECRPQDRLLPEKIEGHIRLRFKVTDLTTDDVAREEIKEKLRKRIASDRASVTKPEEFDFVRPNIRDGSYRVALTADGIGNEQLPHEVRVSNEIQLPPGGQVFLELDRKLITLLETETVSPLTLGGTRLRITGQMLQRFEKQQFQASVGYFRESVDALRKRVASSAPSKSGQPDVFVALPGGGTVEAANVVTSALRESLSVTLSVREGTTPGPIVAILQDSIKGLVRQQELNTCADNTRVTVMMANQVTISATVGEIRKLAQTDAKGRTEQLKVATEDWEARRQSRASNYNGSVSVGGWGVTGALGGGYDNEKKEETEARRKKEAESLQAGFDELKRHFEGDLKTVTGISFDDAAVSASVKSINQDFQANTFTTGYGLHTWPKVSMSGVVDPAVSPTQMADELAKTRRELADTRKLFGNAERMGKVGAGLDRLDAALDRLDKLEAARTKAAAEADAKVKLALDAVDAAEVKRLRAELDQFKRLQEYMVFTNNSFASTAATFAALPKGVPPPRLDCTGKKGVDEATAKAVQAAWAKYLDLKVIEEIDLGDGITMSFALIPPGRYRRGSADSEKSPMSDEGPQRVVTLTKPIYFGVTEVTQEQYWKITGLNPSHFSLESGGGDKLKGLTEAERKQLPVDSVTWEEASSFGSAMQKKAKGLLLRLAKAGLPTEAEWEYACRAGTTTDFWTGSGNDALKRAGWFNNNSNQQTQPVGKLAKNPWGLYDVHGNVWEWCQDSKRTYSADDQTDPQGQSSGDKRVLRGGTWNSEPGGCRAAYRHGSEPANRSSNYGFRVCFRLD